MYEQLKEQLAALEVRACTEASGATTLAELEDLKLKYLGQGGELSTLLSAMGALQPQQRTEIGAIAVTVMKSIEMQVDQCRRLLRN
jgi:phenylalanyl-tRNA synthetase alpha chain